MVKNENGQCNWPQINTNKLLMNKRLLVNKNVCRSITFGSRDVEESNEFLRIELDNLRNKERRRWNFDFYNDRPCSLSDGSDLDDDSENENNKQQENQQEQQQRFRKSHRRYQWTKCQNETLISSS